MGSRKSSDNDLTTCLPQLLDDAQRSAKGYSFSARRKQIFLETLLNSLSDLDLSSGDYKILFVFVGKQVTRKRLDLKQTLGHLILPFSYALNDREEIKEVLSLTVNLFIEHFGADTLIGKDKFDLLIFGGIAALFKKLERSSFNHTDQSLWRATDELADRLCYALKRNPENDRDIIGLIEPYTSLARAVGVRRYVQLGVRQNAHVDVPTVH